MKFLDLTLPAPAENLACDEVLLDLCDENGGDHEVLRFWESSTPFAVLGYSNKVATEVNLDPARQDNVPVLRRVTGGGAVLQGPGCLNYSLILRITDPIHETNVQIMRRHAAALGTGVEVRGTSDLTLGDLKFSGNAQRRKRRALLFHGTFLLDFDIERVERLLPMPSRQPSYRQNRRHRDFLTNIATQRRAIKDVLVRTWQATPTDDAPLETIAALARSRYSSDEWTFKF